jgi:hypothetical protein
MPIWIELFQLKTWQNQNKRESLLHKRMCPSSQMWTLVAGGSRSCHSFFFCSFSLICYLFGFFFSSFHMHFGICVCKLSLGSTNIKTYPRIAFNKTKVQWSWKIRKKIKAPAPSFSFWMHSIPTSFNSIHTPIYVCVF